MLGLIASRLDRLAFGHVGDAQAVGHGVLEVRIHYGPGAGLVMASTFSGGVKCLLCCCVGVTRARRPRTLKMRPDWQHFGVMSMAEKLAPYDPAEDLASEQAMATFMAEAFETSDAAYIAHALGVVARAKGMSQIAGQTGLSREQLYRSFSANGNPTLKSTLAVMKALGIVLSAKASA